MGFFIEAERRLVNRIGIGVEHFKRFSDSDRFSLWRSLFIIVTCFAASFAFGLDLAMASQDTTLPTTVYEVHQYDELQAAKVTIEDLREQIKEINADRRTMHDKNEQWKQDMHDRVTRIEMAGSVTLAVISFLYSIGMMKKFKTSEDELDRKA